MAVLRHRDVLVLSELVMQSTDIGIQALSSWCVDRREVKRWGGGRGPLDEACGRDEEFVSEADVMAGQGQAQARVAPDGQPLLAQKQKSVSRQSHLPMYTCQP